MMWLPNAFFANITGRLRMAIKKMVYSEIEEQKIDIIVSKSGDEPFVKMIFEQGIELR